MLNNEINLVELALLVIKKIWIVVFSTLLVGILAFLYSYFFVVPQYQSKGMIYVDNSNMVSFPTDLSLSKDIQYADMVASQRLATIYIEILKSQTFLNMVSNDSGTDIPPVKLSSMMTILSKNDTEILEITVTYTNPHVASVLAETILENSKTEIPRIFKGGSVQIIDHANVPVRPSSPNHIKYTAIGLVLGLMIGVSIVIAMDLFDNRVKNQDDLTSKYDYPILGSIPSSISVQKVLKAQFNEKSEGERATYYN